MSMRGLLIMTVAALGAGGAATTQAADVQFGPRVSVSDDADFGVGADVRWTFLADDPRLALTGSFDYFFPEDGDDEFEDALDQFRGFLPDDVDLPFDFNPDTEVEYWEANLNLTWDFTTDRAVIPYAGVGVNYAHSRASAFGFDSDESEVGANVLAGMRIRERFYVEAKQEAGGGELFVLTVGVRF
jgi:opacity protein-like surface antigen